MKSSWPNIVAVGIFALLVLGGGVMYGLPLFYAALWSVVATVMVGGLFLYGAQRGFAPTSLIGVGLLILASIAALALSFATDCLAGSVLRPESTLLVACVKHSGPGFILTAGGAVLIVGLTVVSLLNVLLSRIGKHDG